jgi:7,8-dihydropterin-6-yl-methyl-4-(beta-D-ribofuranosyl)aminobenzene 5'-phosphate synthase
MVTILQERKFMRVTTLIENKPCGKDPRFTSEWGLSLYIEFGSRKILFDAGASDSFSENAELLSIDIASIKTAVLSHHHYDHGGGLRRFIELNSSAKIHLGKEPKGGCYSTPQPLIEKYIGIDKTLLTDYPDRFVFVYDRVEILPGVFIFPRISSKYAKPKGNKRLFLKREDVFVQDEFTHEIVMAIKEEGELVVFTGCSHNGVLNMIDTVASAFNNAKVKAVIGGFHLVSSPLGDATVDTVDTEEEIMDIANTIMNYPVGKAYTGHCTSDKAFGTLKGVMGDKLEHLQTGSSFEI